MKPKKRKKSLVGWADKDWKLVWERGDSCGKYAFPVMNKPIITNSKVYDYFIKVRITIEEL